MATQADAASLGSPTLPAWWFTVCTPQQGGCLLRCHIQPRASCSEVVGEHGESLKLRIKAPAVDGAANAALIAFVADALCLPKVAVQLDSGATSRRKRLSIVGLGVGETGERLLRQRG